LGGPPFLEKTGKFEMHELFYISEAQEGISKKEILSILEVSRRDNKIHNITGLLLYWKETNQFMQVLEGRREDIFPLFTDKICKDPRHYSVRMIYSGEIDERGFKDWSMAFKDLDEIDTSRIDGFSDFAKSGFTDELTIDNPSNAIKLIQSFRALIS